MRRCSTARRRRGCERHQAKQGTPTMGGIIIVLGVMIGLALMPGTTYVDGMYGSHDYFSLQGTDQVVWTILLVFAFAMIGFIDDFVVPRLVKGRRGLAW